ASDAGGGVFYRSIGGAPDASETSLGRAVLHPAVGWGEDGPTVGSTVGTPAFTDLDGESRAERPSRPDRNPRAGRIGGRLRLPDKPIPRERSDAWTSGS